MANKGLLSLAESDPNFSNQALENAIDQLKIGWVSKSIDLDTAIADNTVLTTSQKTDLKATINNKAHLNIGRVLGDLVRHTSTVLDGSIIPITDDSEARKFLDLLQEVQAVQTLVPDLFGVPASAKSRSVNDHFGTLNNIFLTTEDSSKPVFTSILDSVTFINNASISTDTLYQTAIDNLKNFINGVTDDSTDFQQTLNTFASAVATAATNFDSSLGVAPYSIKRTQLIADIDKINTQVALENSNLLTVESYSETLSNNISFTSLAEDNDLRQLMARVAQNPNWQSYFNSFETNEENINPIYDTSTDSDKSTIIEEVLASKGLPDVTDHLDLQAVANKAKRDDRIDTANFDKFTDEKIIDECIRQLNLESFGNIQHKSERLLNNLNDRDRFLVSQELDLNEDASTLS